MDSIDQPNDANQTAKGGSAAAPPGEAVASVPNDWLGCKRGLYEPGKWQPADQIEVARFRQIFIWPLTLRLTNLPSPADRGINADDLIDVAIGTAEKAIESLNELWEEVKDLLDHAPPPKATCPPHDVGPHYVREMDAAQRYAEFVYFHDFLQSLLFREEKRGKVPFRVYQRKDVKKAEITLGSQVFRPNVERCNLYLFRTGAALLAIELDFGPEPHVFSRGGGDGTRMSLQDVQRFIDRARRSYTPYFTVNEQGHASASAVPDCFVWREECGETIGKESIPETLCKDLERIRQLDKAGLRSAPMAQHWRTILDPLDVAGYEPENRRLSAHYPVWRHVVDERVPAMSFISLTGAADRWKLPTSALFGWQQREIAQAKDKEEAVVGAMETRRNIEDLWIVSRGDWLRLCYADSPGATPLPYSPGFLEKFEAEACYDRYFPSEASNVSTRYLFAGYHFAAIGAGFFFDTLVVHHFRRMYFQMGLLLHMEFASLLATSSRISAAVRKLKETTGGSDRDGRGYEEFRETLIGIEQDFLEFGHVFRFTGLSNQLQAKEMFTKWRKALGIEALFTDVKTELDTATQFLLSREQVQRADAANNLSTIAAIGVVLGLAFSFLGMNVFFGDKLLNQVLASGNGKPWQTMLRQLLPFGAVLASAGAIGLIVSARLMRQRDDVLRQITRQALVTIMFFGVLCILVAVAGWSRL